MKTTTDSAPDPKASGGEVTANRPTEADRVLVRLIRNQKDATPKSPRFEVTYEEAIIAVAAHLSASLAAKEAENQSLRQRVEWRPIESAPKDDPILVCEGHAKSLPVIAVWIDKKRQWHLFGTELDTKPTHWMPIPEPPQAALSATVAAGEGGEDVSDMVLNWRSMDDPALCDIKRKKERVLLRVPFAQFENPETQFAVTIGFWDTASVTDTGFWRNPDWSRFNVPTHWLPLPSPNIAAHRLASLAAKEAECATYKELALNADALRHAKESENQSLRQRVEDAECRMEGQGTLLANCADTLRSRGFDGEKGPLDERVIAMAQALDAAQADSRRLQEALEMIAAYDKGSKFGIGICPFGCDTPHIARSALSATVAAGKAEKT